MKTLIIGNFEIMEIDREFSSYSDFLEWTETLEGGWSDRNYQLSNYIAKSLYKLGISKAIYEKYSVKLTTEIVVVLYTDRSYGRDIIIDDPIEIKDFIDGNPATGYDSDGGEYTVDKRNVYTINWEENKSFIFLSRKIKE